MLLSVIFPKKNYRIIKKLVNSELLFLGKMELEPAFFVGIERIFDVILGHMGF